MTEQMFESEIVIDKETGQILISRDCPVVFEIIKDIKPNTSLEAFFSKKPKDIFGRDTYKSFCG